MQRPVGAGAVDAVWTDTRDTTGGMGPSCRHRIFTISNRSCRKRSGRRSSWATTRRTRWKSSNRRRVSATDLCRCRRRFCTARSRKTRRTRIGRDCRVTGPAMSRLPTWPRWARRKKMRCSRRRLPTSWRANTLWCKVNNNDGVLNTYDYYPKSRLFSDTLYNVHVMRWMANKRHLS